MKKLARRDDDNALYLCLYINGGSTHSAGVAERLDSILRQHFVESFSLHVIDVSVDPSVLERDDVIALPTLIKHRPGTVSRLVGDLSDETLVLQGMGFPPQRPAGLNSGIRQQAS